MPDIAARQPGALESQWIPMDPHLWKIENYPAFLEARRELLATAANSHLDGLLTCPAAAAEAGAVAVEWSRKEATGAAPSVDESDAEVRTGEVQDLIQWLLEQGYSEPQTDVEVVDRTPGACSRWRKPPGRTGCRRGSPSRSCSNWTPMSSMRTAYRHWATRSSPRAQAFASTSVDSKAPRSGASRAQAWPGGPTDPGGAGPVWCELRYSRSCLAYSPRMPADVDSAAEVTLFLDEDGGLLVRGSSQAVDTVLAELLTPAEIEAHRRVTSRVTDVTAAGASAAAVATTAQEYLRLTAGSLEKVRQFGSQTDGTGALRGYVRDQGGHFAGSLSFETVTFGAEQALALQTAAVSMALRSAIANVEAAVERVEGKVSDIQRRLGSREIGDVVGVYRRLDRVVAATTSRGHLLDADWDAVAGAGLVLEQALETMRAYATLTVSAIDPEARLPKREAAVKDLNDPGGVAGTLQLILIAEQALHLWEYLHLERVRQTDPDHVQSALVEARSSLRAQRERDEELVVAATACIERVRRIDPLEVHYLFAIPAMEDASNRALDRLQEFAEAARAPAPAIGRGLRRPALSETRAEAKRKALDVKDDVIEVAQITGKATARGAKYASRRVRRSSPGTPSDSE